MTQDEMIKKLRGEGWERGWISASEPECPASEVVILMRYSGHGSKRVRYVEVNVDGTANGGEA